MVMPERRCRLYAMSWPMPVPASPAPRNMMRCPGSSRPEPRSAANTVARVMEAVPWMSSLKQHCLCLKLSRSLRMGWEGRVW